MVSPGFALVASDRPSSNVAVTAGPTGGLSEFEPNALRSGELPASRLTNEFEADSLTLRVSKTRRPFLEAETANVSSVPTTMAGIAIVTKEPRQLKRPT